MLNTGCKLDLSFCRFLGFQRFAGLEPSKFRPQTLLCAANQSPPLVHKMGGLFREFLLPFCPALSGMKVTQSSFYISLKGLIRLLKPSSSSYSTALDLFINRQSMLSEIGRDNEHFLIRKPLLLLSCTVRLPVSEPRHCRKALKDYRTT